MFHKTSILTAALIVVLLLTGCGGRESQQEQQSADDAGVTIDLAYPDPLTVGEMTLMITLTDADGNPINDATLAIRGDMNHAGMQPVLRDAEAGEEGVYEVPFEWTMGGDWIVTIAVTLADGTEVSETFDLSVETAGEMDMDMTDEPDMSMTDEAADS